jgi:hypothetical protein
LGYKVRADKRATPVGTSFPREVTRTIADQFGSRLCTIKKEKTVTPPPTRTAERFRTRRGA